MEIVSFSGLNHLLNLVLKIFEEIGTWYIITNQGGTQSTHAHFSQNHLAFVMLLMLCIFVKYCRLHNTILYLLRNVMEQTLLS